MTDHAHKVTFNIPGEGYKVHELYIIPRVGEIVIFDKREWQKWPRYKVIDVINNIDKSRVLGWCGLYLNKITVVLEEA